eukprot:799317-Lingulodinium_polyedra.AAC.1
MQICPNFNNQESIASIAVARRDARRTSATALSSSGPGEQITELCCRTTSGHVAGTGGRNVWRG